MATAQDAMLAGLFANSRSEPGPADIGQFEKTVQANNIYRQIAAPILGAQFNTGTWNPWTAFAVSAGQGLLGTGLNQLAQNNEASQLEKVAAILPQLYQNPNAIAAPAGVDASAFGGLKLDALKQQSILGIRDEENKFKIFTDIAQRSPGLAVQAMPEMAAKLGIKLPEVSSSGGIETLPQDLKDVAVKELATVGSKKQSFDFVDDKFDQAKKLTGTSAAAKSIFGIPTSEGEQLSGIAQSLIYQIDNVIGREVNSDVRRQFADLTPKWYDSDKELELKKNNFKELLAGLAKPTPILDMAGIKTEAASTEPMVTVRNKKTGQTMRVPRSQLGGG